MIYLTALLAPPQKGAKNEVKDFDLSNSKQNIMNSNEISKLRLSELKNDIFEAGSVGAI